MSDSLYLLHSYKIKIPQQNMKMRKIIAFVMLLVLVMTKEGCLNHKKEEVDWFLILRTPGSISKGYLYYDSTMQDADLTFYSAKADSLNHPISNTFQQINKAKLNIVAWNDKFPNGTTSSTKAHSKNIIAYDDDYQGLVIIHSMPGYPSIIKDQLNQTIDDSQNIYAQHFFCITTGNYTKEILLKSSIISPFTYANTKNQVFSLTTNSLFQNLGFPIGNTTIAAIYKNGKSSNGSIFQDGLTLLLNSDLVAESWGRPYQQKWCGNESIPFYVGNSKGINHSPEISWKVTQDHSKWALTKSENIFYVCLGDMNRMQSQWKRGGGFMCIEHKTLHQALNKKLVEPQECSKKAPLSLRTGD